jgi:hypothetical protein
MVQVHEVGATPMPEDGITSLMHALRLTGNAHIWMLLLTFHNLSSKSNEFCDIILVMLSDLLATFSFTFFLQSVCPFVGNLSDRAEVDRHWGMCWHVRMIHIKLERLG